MGENLDEEERKLYKQKVQKGIKEGTMKERREKR